MHYLLIIMHINLNNQGDHFLQLSPMIGRADQSAPSPLLSPDPLFLMLNDQPDLPQFRLEPEGDFQHDKPYEVQIDNLSPPIPYPSNMQPLDQSEDNSSRDHQKLQEPQPQIRKKKEPKSAKSTQIKEQPLPPLKFPSKDLPAIRAIIEFLVENSGQPEKELLQQGRSLWGERLELGEVLACLVGKFKKLRKTKQEMTKYCMRKVFKFIADRMKRDRTHNRDVDSCMKLYFAKTQAGNAFSIPFKKNSVEKTMNGNFLKRVFASDSFANDYRDFLRQFQALMTEDNEKKIIYLAEMLEKCILANDLKKIESIKRLPWTRQILGQTEQLAVSLLSYTERKQKSKDQ